MYIRFFIFRQLIRNFIANVLYASMNKNTRFVYKAWRLLTNKAGIAMLFDSFFFQSLLCHARAVTNSFQVLMNDIEKFNFAFDNF